MIGESEFQRSRRLDFKPGKAGSEAAGFKGQVSRQRRRLILQSFSVYNESMENISYDSAINYII